MLICMRFFYRDRSQKNRRNSSITSTVDYNHLTAQYSMFPSQTRGHRRPDHCSYARWLPINSGRRSYFQLSVHCSGRPFGHNVCAYTGLVVVGLCGRVFFGYRKIVVSFESLAHTRFGSAISSGPAIGFTLLGRSSSSGTCGQSTRSSTFGSYTTVFARLCERSGVQKGSKQWVSLVSLELFTYLLKHQSSYQVCLTVLSINRFRY